MLFFVHLDMYYFGAIAYLVMLTYFCYFAYTSYMGAISQAYISLDGSSGDCSNVEITVSGTYLADNRGNWVGSPQFVYANALYSMSLSNFEGSNAQYSDMMTYFNTVLIDLGKDGRADSLPYNLARWSSFIRYYSLDDPSLTNFTSTGYGQLQYLQLTGDPQTIFNLAYQQMVMGSTKGYCTETGYSQYDQANGLIYATLNYTHFISSPVCEATAIPDSFGYSDVLDNNIFEIKLEVRAFMTAFAVNSGILDVTSLYRSGSDSYNFEFSNVSYVAGEYFDIRYSAMKPILCMYNTSVAPPGYLESLCFYFIGSTVSLPVFNHFGLSSMNPVYCSCSNGNGKSGGCDSFNLMASLVYYPTSVNAQNLEAAIEDQISLLLKALKKFPSYNEFNRQSFNATWGAASIAYGRQSPAVKTTSWIKNAFSFCDIGTNDCGLTVFHSVDLASQLVSVYKFQLSNGSCHDSFTIPLTYYDNLVNTPPVVLVENYYECYQDVFTAFMDALGIASGNTQLAVPITVVFLLPMVYFILVAIKQAPPKEEYTNIEKKQALEILSILLLRLRDGKSRGVKRNGILMQLTNELIKAAKEESGFPDSDDEEEDDNDDDDDDDDDDENEDDEDDEESKTPRSKSTKTVTLDDSDDEEDAVRESMAEERKKQRKLRQKSIKTRSRKSSVDVSRPSLGPSSAPKSAGGRKMGVFTR
jgi:TRAP-type C4-dicarboxylate transport system permease small subunit